MIADGPEFCFRTMPADAIEPIRIVIIITFILSVVGGDIACADASAHEWEDWLDVRS